jgi:hypothetical protein
MIYYYIYTGHKNSLHRIRRGAVLYKALKAQGHDVSVLINDFRAGLEAREYGIESYVTISTILDVDAMAKMGDSVIIDSSEDDKGKMEYFVRDYQHVFKFANSGNETSQFGETVLPYDAFLIDDAYQNAATTKMDRVLFFYGDSDPNKELLEKFTIFKNNNFDLLLGHYFYLGYENELQPLFNHIYESEEYVDRVSSYANVVTYSLQCAIEAKVAGANVVFVSDKTEDRELAQTYNIAVIDQLDDALIEENLQNQQANAKALNTPMQTVLESL